MYIGVHEIPYSMTPAGTLGYSMELGQFKDLQTEWDAEYAREILEASKTDIATSSSAEQLTKKIVKVQKKSESFLQVDVTAGSPDVLTWDEVFDRTRVVHIAIYQKGKAGDESPLVVANNFFITSITTVHSEQFQLIRGNEGFSIYPFGEQPQIIAIGGVFDESNANQMVNFFLKYIQLIRLKAAFNQYDVVIFQPPSFYLLGYFVSFQFDERAESLPAIPFGCSFLIKKRYIISTEKQKLVNNMQKNFIEVFEFDLSELERKGVFIDFLELLPDPTVKIIEKKVQVSTTAPE